MRDYVDQAERYTHEKAILKNYPNYAIYENGTVIHNKTNRVLSVDNPKWSFRIERT